MTDYFAKLKAEGKLGIADTGKGIIASSTCAVCGRDLEPGDERRKDPIAKPTPPFYCDDCWCCPNCGDHTFVSPEHDEDPWCCGCVCGERWRSWDEFDRCLSLYWLHRAEAIQRTFRERGPFVDEFGK